MKGERKRNALYKERVQTRQLRTRPRTAIKSRNKQTTSSPPFCRLPEEPTTRFPPFPIALTIVGTSSRDFSAAEQRRWEKNRRRPFPSIAILPPRLFRLSLSLVLSSASFRSRVVSLSRFASPLISAGENDASTRRGVPVRFDRIFQGPLCARARKSNTRSYRGP